MDHKVKVLNRLQVGHLNWIEDSTVKADLTAAKKVVQEALKPGQVPGGSEEDNQGIFMKKIRSINFGSKMYKRSIKMLN